MASPEPEVNGKAAKFKTPLWTTPWHCAGFYVLAFIWGPALYISSIYRFAGYSLGLDPELGAPYRQFFAVNSVHFLIAGATSLTMAAGMRRLLWFKGPGKWLVPSLLATVPLIFVFLFVLLLSAMPTRPVDALSFAFWGSIYALYFLSWLHVVSATIGFGLGVLSDRKAISAELLP